MHLRNLHIAEGVRALLGLLDGLGQTDNADLDLCQLDRQGLDLIEFEVGHIEGAVCRFQIVVQPQRRGGVQLEGGQLHAHNAAGAELHAALHRHTGRIAADRAQHDIGLFQGLVGLGIGRRDAVLYTCRAVDQLHHLAHQDIALAVHQVIALRGQRQTALGRHQVRFCRKNLLCHWVLLNFR